YARHVERVDGSNAGNDDVRCPINHRHGSAAAVQYKGPRAIWREHGGDGAIPDMNRSGHRVISDADDGHRSRKVIADVDFCLLGRRLDGLRDSADADTRYQLGRHCVENFDGVAVGVRDVCRKAMLEVQAVRSRKWNGWDGDICRDTANVDCVID